MKKDEALALDLLLHKTMEYDAQDGEDKYRVTMTTEWMPKSSFQRLVGLSDVGVVRAAFEEVQREEVQGDGSDAAVEDGQGEDVDPRRSAKARRA